MKNFYLLILTTFSIIHGVNATEWNEGAPAPALQALVANAAANKPVRIVIAMSDGPAITPKTK